MFKKIGRAPSIPRHTASMHCIAMADGATSPTTFSLQQATSLANLPGHPNTEKTVMGSFLPFNARRSQPSILSIPGSCYSPITEDGRSESSENGAMVTGSSCFKMSSSFVENEETGNGSRRKSAWVTQSGAARPLSEQSIAEETDTTGRTDSGAFKSKPIQAKIKKKHLRHPDVDKSKVWSKSTHIRVDKDITHVKFAICPGITDPLHGCTHTSLFIMAHLSKNQRKEMERMKTSYKIRVSCEASEDSELKFPEPVTVAFEIGEDQLRYHQYLMSRTNLDQCSHDIITLTFTATIIVQPKTETTSKQNTRKKSN